MNLFLKLRLGIPTWGICGSVIRLLGALKLPVCAFQGQCQITCRCRGGLATSHIPSQRPVWAARGGGLYPGREQYRVPARGLHSKTYLFRFDKCINDDHTPVCHLVLDLSRWFRNNHPSQVARTCQHAGSGDGWGTQLVEYYEQIELWCQRQK